MRQPNPEDLFKAGSCGKPEGGSERAGGGGTSDMRNSIHYAFHYQEWRHDISK
jgi:hypothetical protein